MGNAGSLIIDGITGYKYETKDFVNIIEKSLDNENLGDAAYREYTVLSIFSRVLLVLPYVPKAI